MIHGFGLMAIHFDLSLEPVYGVEQRLSQRIARLLAPNPSPFTFRGTGVYIVGAGDGVAVIDPGPDLPDHVAALKRALAGRTVSHILITHTHKDHSPAAQPLKEWSGAKTYGFGPHLETNDVEEGGDRLFVPDIRVTDGQHRGRGFHHRLRFHAWPHLQPYVLCAAARKSPVHRRSCDGLVHQRDRAARRQYGRLHAQPGKADRPRR